MIKIGIIIGSTRPGRKAEAVAKPAPMHEVAVNTMLDQVIAWSSALRPLRYK